jgi:hypothetical protein
LSNPRSLPSLLAALALVLLAPISAGAMDFSVHGSYWDTDDFGESVGAGARLTFFSTLQLELGVSYFEDFGEDFDFDLDDPGLETITLEIEAIPVDIGARVNLGGRRGVYLGAGGTLYLLDTPTGSVDDEVGYYARVGLQFRSFFVEAGYREVEGTLEDLDFDDIDDLDDLDIGDSNFDLTGFFVNAGWRF